jgi:hypothetical protein
MTLIWLLATVIRNPDKAFVLVDIAHHPIFKVQNSEHLPSVYVSDIYKKLTYVILT